MTTLNALPTRPEPRPFKTEVWQKFAFVIQELGPLMFSWLPRHPLKIGSTAPDFTLPTETGKKVKLSSLRGKNVVLVFYPGDDTMICRKQLCEFRDAWPDVRGQNIVVYGVNPQSAESHREFRERYHFPFPLLVDDEQKVAALYNSDGGMVNRTVYLIGPDGKIRYARRGMPRPEEVLEAAEKPKRLMRKADPSRAKARSG
jgi:thioredoxin-dependent peroxiredoxin